MSDVQFEEDNTEMTFSRPVQAFEQETFMIRFLIKNNIAKNKKSAQRMLLVSAVSLFCISGIIFFISIHGGVGEKAVSGLSPQTLKDLRSYAEKHNIHVKF
jgi:hypothetical protein